MNHLATFDFDKTLSRKFLITPIIQAEQEAGLLAPGTYEESAALLAEVSCGAIEYEDGAERLLAIHAVGLRGRGIDELQDHARAYLSKHSELFRTFSTGSMDLLRPTHELVAVTAEPEYMAEAVVDYLDMDRAIATQYEVSLGRFTGRVAVSLTHRSQKRKLIGPLHPHVAFGDSAGDIMMLEHAQNAYCISPDGELAKA